jgi:ABC-type dipeptide/oligopeptide/nickel transport system permease subunit
MIYSQLSDLSASPPVWLVPSILIFLTVLALNDLGDVVRSRFDVRESVL